MSGGGRTSGWWGVWVGFVWGSVECGFCGGESEGRGRLHDPGSGQELLEVCEGSLKP
jgi:hypothetical protein